MPPPRRSILHDVGSKYRAYLLILMVAALCGLSVWGVVSWRHRPIPAAALMKRIPVANPLVVYIDFKYLHDQHILERLLGSKPAQDPDYQAFIDKTGFDAQEDLQAALLAFAPDARYLLVKGQFDWKKLKSYAKDQGGSCQASLCTVRGSSAERNISFFPVQTNLMGMAVSQDETAARHLQEPDSRPDPEVPNAPVWVWIPPAALKSHDQFPSGTHLFASALERADHLTLSFDGAAGHWAIKLDARCRTEDDAIRLTSELSAATARLKQMLELEHHAPNPADLTGVLSSGSFQSTGNRVTGQWQIEQVFVDKVFGEGLG